MSTTQSQPTTKVSRSWANVVSLENELVGLAEESRDGINLFMKRAMSVAPSSLPLHAAPKAAPSASVQEAAPVTMSWKAAIFSKTAQNTSAPSSSDAPSDNDAKENKTILTNAKKRLACDIAKTPRKVDGRKSAMAAFQSSDELSNAQQEVATASSDESSRGQRNEKKQRASSWSAVVGAPAVLESMEEQAPANEDTQEVASTECFPLRLLLKKEW